MRVHSINNNVRFGLIAIILGFLLGMIVVDSNSKIINYKSMYYSGYPNLTLSSSTYKIASDISYSDNSQKFKICPTQHDNSCRDEGILLTTNLAVKYEYGDLITVSGIAKMPEVIYPDPSTSIHTFDYREYLYSKDIKYIMSYAKLSIIGRDDGTLSNVIRILYRIKWSLVNNLEQSIKSPESGLAAGMILGIDGLMGREAESAMQVAGLSHITVLSGYNLIILIASVFYILKYIPWRIRVVVSALVISLFAIMVGGGSSLWRALLMTYIGMIGLMSYRAVSSKIIFWYAYILIVIISPFSLLKDVSLHLSVLATIGLIYFSKPIFGFLSEYNFAKRHLEFTELLAANIAVYLTTAPYIAYQFSNANMMSFINNLIVSPLVPFVMLLSFVVSVLYYVSPLLATIVGYIDYTLLHFLLWIAGDNDQKLAHAISVKSYLEVNTNAMLLVYSGSILVYLFSLVLMKRK